MVKKSILDNQFKNPVKKIISVQLKEILTHKKNFNTKPNNRILKRKYIFILLKWHNIEKLLSRFDLSVHYVKVISAFSEGFKRESLISYYTSLLFPELYNSISRNVRVIQFDPFDVEPDAV